MGNTGAVRRHGKDAAVHPHACGEHREAARHCPGSCGSSPRLWGTPCPAPGEEKTVRFIPTPVGNTVFPCTPIDRWPVHPHACGEHERLSGENQEGGGSSPRLWGTLYLLHAAALPVRFIPTPVGNTIRVTTQPGSQAGSIPTPVGNTLRAHASKVAHLVASGSSPRLWGTPALSVCCTVDESRFIPTPVGNTWCEELISFSRDPVHPHACGEH